MSATRHKTRSKAACHASVDAELQAFIRDRQTSLNELIASKQRILSATLAEYSAAETGISQDMMEALR